MALTPLPFHEIGLEEAVRIVFKPTGVITLDGQDASHLCHQADERSWQHSEEQWMVATHVASMDIKESDSKNG